ncbi:hypothetical protein BCR42DRAFT_496748 [Absidia repens]|uniref:F-box domain-containing protein n=1 Tax=Absidia repens TaxID=90262 RepID=A0A1X2HYH4_9FUNG|nr:hypothetical protein BCR42DRAFT_496748 [Absidia repens]
MSIQLLPTSLLYEIIKSVPFPNRWETSLVCKSWYNICTDPYLYQEIQLESMELEMLVRALQWIERLGVISVRSLNIRHCHSDFLQNTIVPVMTTTTSSYQPTLYSQLRTLTPDRRRMEYVKQEYRLYDILSDTLARLLSTKKLARLEISNCDLDWAMTELFTILITYGAGRHLTTWIYHDNYNNDCTPTVSTRCTTTHGTDKSISSSTPTPAPKSTSNSAQPGSDLLQALVMACPNMKHFMGHHGTVNDAMIMIMAQYWPQLESLVLLSNDNHPSISAKAFYSLISQCSSLHTLELYDLECINQDDLIQMRHWRDATSIASTSPPSPLGRQRRHQPYPSMRSRRLKTTAVGNALRHVKLTKYITAPLSTQAILHLLAFFPHLRTLTYETNRTCYEIAQHQSKEENAAPVKDQWHSLVQWQNQHYKSPSPLFCFRLNYPPTMNQLLLLSSYQVNLSLA